MTNFPIIFITHDTRRIFARLNGNRLIDHATKLLVVTHFDVSRYRKVFPERIANKSVISKYPAKIRMAIEHDAIKIKSLTLKPIHTRPDVTKGIKNRKEIIVGKSAKPEPIIISHRKQMSRNREPPLRPDTRKRRIIEPREINELFKTKLRIVAEHSGDAKIIGSRNDSGDFATSSDHSLEPLTEFTGQQLTEAL